MRGRREGGERDVFKERERERYMLRREHGPFHSGKLERRERERYGFKREYRL